MFYKGENFMADKRRFGDRRDGKLIRNPDAMHFVMPLIYPNRCDNEAFVSERIDLSKLNAYLEKKNTDGIEYKYNLFQVLVAAMLKTVTLRPKMNYFIANGNMYERNEITAAFVVKKIFSDDGGEGLAFIHAKPTDNIDTLHNEIYRQVSSYRGGGGNSSTEDSMDTFSKLPRFICRIFGKIVRALDRRGKVPHSLIAGDPYYSTVLISNLGSIKLHSAYHHLTNWGTTSIFMTVGERKPRPFLDENGSTVIKDSVDIGLTIDERIADGYYYSKTVRLLKKLIENPELLEDELAKEIDY